MANLLLRLLWAGVVAAALWFLFRGLWANVYIEPTGDALAEARRGRQVVLLASIGLSLAALASFTLLRQPKVVGVALLAPVVICGGLLLILPDTLLPQIAVLVAYPIAFAGLCWGLVSTSRRPEES